MSFRAKVQKWSGMPWFDFSNLLAWLPRQVGINSLTNPNLQIVSVTNDRSETVCYVPIEKVFLARSYAVSPKATPSEALQAGNAADEVIEREAQRAGVGKVLFVLSSDHPPMPEEKWLRVIEREIEQFATVPEVGFTASAPATYSN